MIPNPRAFPCWFGEGGGAHDGMTLRDYFAAKAMQSQVPDFLNPMNEKTTLDDVVRNAYQMADAMLKERQIR